MLRRDATEAMPEVTAPLALGVEAVPDRRHCLTVDQFTTHTEHSGWIASDGTTVVWETRLLKIGEPYTTFLDAEGTPVP